MAAAATAFAIHTARSENSSLSSRSSKHRRMKLSETSVFREQSLSAARLFVGRFLRSALVDGALVVFVCLSFLLVIVEADSKGDPATWVQVANYVLLGIFFIEAATRMFVLRARYFCYPTNILDLTLIVTDVLAIVLELFDVKSMPSFMVLRIFRLSRLFRSFKVLVRFPQLAMLVRGLFNSLSVVGYGVGFLGLIILFWSVGAVHFIHPVNMEVASTGQYDDCGRCERAFETVASSALTIIQQVVAGDSWGMVSIPIIEHSPVTALFFGAVFMTVNIIALNMILAVIVDTALKAGQECNREIVKHKLNEFDDHAKQIKELCKEMDSDDSGDLTLEELMAGFEENEQFRDLLMAMDVKKSDMTIVFGILDADEDGTVNYDEFVNELFKMKTHDSHTLLVFIKHYVTDIRKDVRAQIKVLKGEFMARLDQQAHNRQPAPLPRAPASAKEETLGTDHCPGCVPLEEKEKESGVAPPGHEGSGKGLMDELRTLRAVINEDLVRGMQEITRKSESHERLLASIAGDTSLLRGGAEPGLQPPLMDGGSGFSAMDVATKRDSLDAALGRRQWPRSAQPAPTSVWGMKRCCSVERAGTYVPPHLVS